MKNAKFDTVYKNAKAWAKSKNMSALGLYQSFRNETNLNFSLSCDDTHREINQPEYVYLAQKTIMTVKEMCRLYFKMRSEKALSPE